MKKAILIVLVLLVGAFLMFFDINFEEGNRLIFLEEYRNEIRYSDYEAEQIFSTNKDEEGLRITFIGCSIDTTNMEQFGPISRKLAIQLNQEVNTDNEFRNFIIVFKPKDPAGIKINEFMSIDELKFQHRASELNN